MILMPNSMAMLMRTPAHSCTHEIKSTFHVLLSTMATNTVCAVIQTKIMILTHDDPYLNWGNSIQQFAVIDAIPSQ